MSSKFSWRRATLVLLGIPVLLAACSKKPETPASDTGNATNAAPAAPAPSPFEPVNPGPSASAQAYVDFGVANGARGDLGAAVDAFNSAISLDPKFASAYYYRGFAEVQQGKYPEAMKDFTQAIDLDPKSRDAYNQRGNLHGRLGEFDAAIADYQAVVSVDPNFAEAYYSLGHVYYHTGKVDDAGTQLDAALSRNPNLPFAYYIRGLIRHAQGHMAEATADFRKSVGLDFADAAFWLYICETEDGLKDAAKRDLSDAMEKPQLFKAGDFQSAVGGYLLGRTKIDDLMAKAASGSPLDQSNQTCAAWFYAGMAAKFGGDRINAREDFKKALATNATSREEYTEAQRELAAMPGL
jgi:tetratricopeptide (TPR) repeat protein